MKRNNKNPIVRNIISVALICIVCILFLSFLLQGNTDNNYEQESMNNPNKKLQISSINVPEQQWNTTWGGSGYDSAIDIALDSSNNIYITGTYNATEEPPSSTIGDIVLLKYNSLGEFQWNKTWGGSGKDTGRAIAVDSSNNIYLVGSAAGGDIVFLKYNSLGELQWDKSWSSSGIGYAITLDLVGNIFIAGGQSGDMILWKFNSLGVYQWERTWGGINTDTGWTMTVDSSNNIYVAGLTYNILPDIDLFLLKYNSSGVLQWDSTWGGSGFEDAHSIALDSSNNIFVAGETNSFGAGSYDLSLVKFNSSGQLQWNKTWGGSDSELGWDMLALDSSSNIYLAAHTSSFGAGLYDGILVKYNSMGQQQWNTTWGGSGDDEFASIIVDSSNNIFLVGKTDSFGAGGDDVVLIKYGKGPVDNGSEQIPWYVLFLLVGTICVATAIVTAIVIKKRNKSIIS